MQANCPNLSIASGTKPKSYSPNIIGITTLEANFALRFDCENAVIRRKVIEFLNDDTRPVFIEDVEKQYEYLFNALEYVENPDSLDIVGETTVHAYFLLGGDYEQDMMDLLKSFLKAKVQYLVAYLEADDDIVFIYEQKGKFKEYKKWDEDRVDEARADSNKGFAYLDELSHQLYKT